MPEQPLFPDVAADERIVNVASVPLRSPFRNPGEKTPNKGHEWDFTQENVFSCDHHIPAAY